MDIHALFAKTLAPVLIPDPALSGAKLYPLCIALWIVAASSPNVHGSGIAGFTHRRFHQRSRSQKSSLSGLSALTGHFHASHGLGSYPLNNSPLPTSYPQVGKTCGFLSGDPRSYSPEGATRHMNYTCVSY